MDDSHDSESGDGDNESPSNRLEDPGADEVLLLNRQRSVRANWPGLRAFLGELHHAVARRPFSVCLVSDRAMRRYNRLFRQHDEATDVLSFPANGSDRAKTGHPDLYLGDIVISVETARSNAARYGLKLEEEIRVLALHGVLHLMGYDHETDRGRMARAERRWSRKLGLAGSLTARPGLGTRTSRAARR